MKLGTNIHHVSGHCWEGFQGRRSKVKVMSRPKAIMAEACILMLWRRGWLVLRLLLRTDFHLTSTTKCLLTGQCKISEHSRRRTIRVLISRGKLLVMYTTRLHCGNVYRVREVENCFAWTIAMCITFVHCWLAFCHAANKRRLIDWLIAVAVIVFILCNIKRHCNLMMQCVFDSC